MKQNNRPNRSPADESVRADKGNGNRGATGADEGTKGKSKRGRRNRNRRGDCQSLTSNTAGPSQPREGKGRRKRQPGRKRSPSIERSWGQTTKSGTSTRVLKEVTQIRQRKASHERNGGGLAKGMYSGQTRSQMTKEPWRRS